MVFNRYWVVNTGRHCHVMAAGPRPLGSTLRCPSSCRAANICKSHRATASSAAILVRQHRQLSSGSYVSAGAFQLSQSHRRRSRLSRSALRVNALVAVDYSQPAIWLGLSLIGGGLSLYQLRRVQPVLSRDFDIVVSSVVIFSGGILIFQGWRLDPLLLFCQLLTAGTALAWALEAIKLRSLVENDQKFDERARQYPPLNEPMPRENFSGRGIPLPSPREEEFGRWYGEPPEAEEMATVSGRDFYSVRGQDAFYPAGRVERYQDEDEYYYGQPNGEDPPAYYEDEQGFAPPAGSRTSAEDEDGENASGQAEPGKVMNSVESFYNRPESVTEDVERFYDRRRPDDGDQADEGVDREAWDGSSDSGNEGNYGDEFLDDPRQSWGQQTDSGQGYDQQADGYENGPRREGPRNSPNPPQSQGSDRDGRW